MAVPIAILSLIAKHTGRVDVANSREIDIKPGRPRLQKNAAISYFIAIEASIPCHRRRAICLTFHCSLVPVIRLKSSFHHQASRERPTRQIDVSRGRPARYALTRRTVLILLDSVPYKSIIRGNSLSARLPNRPAGRSPPDPCRRHLVSAIQSQPEQCINFSARHPNCMLGLDFCLKDFPCAPEATNSIQCYQ
jgi:hypothetical protein